MRVLVVFFSETGNTEKIARIIHKEASERHEAHLKKIQEVTAETLDDHDVVFLGSACHSADLAAPVKKILKAIPQTSRFKLAGFFTHSCPPEARHKQARELFIRWAGKCITSFEKASKEKQIEFMGYFNCQGMPSLPIQEFIKKEILLSKDEWEEYLDEARKHPSPEDAQRAKDFARKILSKL